MSRNIVFEGWLTKSPPSKRIWRTKWRRRWFALRQSGELPGQYFLDYYADRNCRRLKGTINLDLCEQVDAGLHMERAGNGNLDPKLRGSVFTIQTQSRTYHLEADCEAEMEKWVDAICRVCGLRPAAEEVETYHYRPNEETATMHYECADPGPYIPISECVTGVRAGRRNAFSFDSKQLAVSAQKTAHKIKHAKENKHIYINPDLSIDMYDQSEGSEAECGSLKPILKNKAKSNDANANQETRPNSDIDSASGAASGSNPSATGHEGSVTKTFTSLAVNGNNKEATDGPPVPPRPIRTLPTLAIEGKAITNTGAEPLDPVQQSIANYTGPGTPWLRVPARSSRSPRSTSRKARSSTSPQWTLITESKRAPPSAAAPKSPILGQSAPDTTKTADAPRSPVANAAQSVLPRPKRQSFTESEADNITKSGASIAATGAFGNLPKATQPTISMAARSGVAADATHSSDDEDGDCCTNQSLQYYNLPTVCFPPAVDRALKPRLPSKPVSYNPVSNSEPTSTSPHFQNIYPTLTQPTFEHKTNDTLHYLDLDLPSSPVNAEASGIPKIHIIHGKTMSDEERESVYKTVDFVKTEAFNSTRQDAEALRSYQC